MPGKAHIHSDRWHRCVDKVRASGNVDSPEAVCTAALGDDSFLSAAQEDDAFRMVDLRIQAGKPSTVREDNIVWTVVPVTALVEGVIRAINSPHPEFVAAEKFSAAPQGWDGRPIFFNHPMENGKPISGNSPEVLKTAIGRVHNARVDGKRLLMDAWLHPEKAKDIIARVQSGKPVEISTGAHVILSDASGNHGGKAYQGAWDAIYPDHLAILPEGSRGACSFDMGCGIRASMMHEVDGDTLRIAAEMDESCIDTWRTAIGKRNSSTDLKMLQDVHDTTVKLGAQCDTRSDAQKAIDGIRGMRAACSCQEKEISMEKAQRITALMEHPFSPVKDKAILEAASDAMLSSLESAAKKAKDKAEEDAESEAEKKKELQGLKDAVAEKDTALKAAQAKPKTEEEWLAEAPADLRSLVEESKAEKAAQKTALIVKLKAAQSIYSEDELKGMDVKQLTKIAALAQVKTETVDYSGRGGHRAAAEHEESDYFKQPPPDGYKAALERRQKGQVN